MKKLRVAFVSILTLVVLAISGVLALNNFVSKKQNNYTQTPKTQETQPLKTLNNKKLLSTFDENDIVNSSYLICQQADGSVAPYNEQSVVAGQTSGYGKFVLNAKNVTLLTSANVGFELRGWSFSYESGSTETSKFLQFDSEEEGVEKTKNGLVYTVETETIGDQPVTISIDFFDNDKDGFFDEGSFNISNVFSNMTVEPVFDYIYYNLDITSVFNLTNILSTYKSVDVAGSMLYYSTAEGNVYSNAFLKTASQVLYFNQVKSSEGEFYTSRIQNDVEQKIDLSRGGFRYGENINLTLNIDAKKELLAESGVNIDVKNVSLTEDENVVVLPTDKAGSSWAEISKDEFERTTNVQFSFYISNTKNQTSYINFDLDNLYVATIKPTVDGKNEADGNEYIKTSINLVVESLQLNYYYSQVDSTTYLVKNSSQNENNYVFELFCQSAIYGDSYNYVYYTFNELTLSENVEDQSQIVKNNLLQYADINDNFEIYISYSSFEYYINFVAYLQLDDEKGLTRITDPDFAIDEGQKLLRGESYVCGNSGTASNVGYNFIGYTLTDLSYNDSLTVTIDMEHPQDIEVKMVYKYIDYFVRLNDYDTIYLDNGPTRIMPIELLNVTVNEKSVDLSNELRSGANKYEQKSLTIANDLNLGYTVSVSIRANNGFILKSFYISQDNPEYCVNNADNKIEILTLNFTINKEFLQFLIDNSLLSSNQISLKVSEDFIRYSFIYYIEETFDPAQSKNIIMADIDASTLDGDARFSYYYIGDETGYTSKQEKENLHRIVIDNLKLYDTINLKAISKEHDGVNYEYIRFTEKNITSLKDNYDEASKTATASRVIDKNNISIKVIYSSSKSRFTITTNMPNAFGNENEEILFSNYLEIYQNFGDSKVKADIDSNNEVVIRSGQFSVSFLPNKQFNFGYRFKNYLLNVDNITQDSRNVTGSSYPYLETFSITIREGVSVCELNLEFELINFRVILKQYGEGYVDGNVKAFNGEIYSFEDGYLYKDLNVENNNLKVVLPEGSYITKFYFNNEENTIFDSLGQTNSSTDLEFNHKFSVAEIQNYFLTYGTYLGDYFQIDLNLDYAIHTYTVAANYRFYLTKGEATDNKMIYPSLYLTYSFKGEDFKLETEQNNKYYAFNNIPYGVLVKVGLKSALPIGYTSFDSWGSELDVGDNLGNTNGLDWIEIPKLVSNRNLVYLIDYQSYLIEIVDESNFVRGDALVEVKMGNVYNNYKRVELYDAFKITFLANRQMGYKFSKMWFFVPYTLGQAGWEENEPNIYVYSSNQFEKAGAIFDESLTYYLKQEYSENIVYEDNNLQLENYAIISNKIIFFSQFDYIKINLKNETADLDLSLTKAGINLSDYASYNVFKLVEDEFVNLNELEDKTLIVTDVVRIEVKLNTVEIKNITNTKLSSIELFRGVSLFRISYVDLFNSTGKGNYSLEFNMQSVVDRIDTQDNLVLTYFYKVETKQVELTTNIKSQKFYNNFVMSYRGVAGFEEFNNTLSEPVLTSNLQFLAGAEFTYSFNGIDTSLFDIKNVRFYKLAQKPQLINPDDYAYYGIEIVYGDKILVSIRFLDNVRIELQVEPNLIFNAVGETEKIEQDENDDYWFYKMFECDNSGNGIEKEQILTLGETKGFNIQAANLILDCIKIKYVDEEGFYVNPKNVGQYAVLISFEAGENADYDWINEIILSYDVHLVITPKPLNLTYENFNFTKVYDGGSSIDFGQISNHIVLTDGKNFVINFANNKFKFSQIPTCTITATNRQGQEEVNVDVGVRLNILLSKLALTTDGFNKNFTLNLDNGNFVMLGVVTITQRPLYLVSTGENDVYDKVYDGTKVVDYDAASFSLGRGLIEADRQYISVDFENLSFEFEDAEIGKDKTIVANAAQAIKDVYANIHKAQNYKLMFNNYTASIYPFSVSAYVAGVGEIIIYNQRGLMDSRDSEHNYRQYVNLIPIDAELEVQVIYADSFEYRQIYSILSKYLSNLTEFAIGYKMNFNVAGSEQAINNKLYLSLPTVSRLNQALWLSQSSSGKLQYSISKARVNIDLSQMDENFTGLAFTQSRRLLTWWQISLIILLILIIIILLILIYIHERRKKRKQDELNEKI